MRHPTETVLRRLLDEPAGVADPDRRHVAGCQQCLREVAASPVDADRPERAAPRRAGGSGRLLRRPLVAAVAVAVVLTGAGTAAANDWVQIFRTQSLAPLSLSTADLVALPDLSAYGDVVVTEELDVIQVRDAAAAADVTGLDVPEVTSLPRGVTGRPVYRVGGAVSATFTFSPDRAAQAAAEAGEALPTPPPGLEDSPVRLDAGPGVVQTWSSSTRAPALVVGRAVAPTAFTSGLPFGTVRDYLLTLPGLPEHVAAQLRTFTGDGSTLPLPVPADQVVASAAQVGGEPATVLTSRDRTMAAVVWVDDGVVTAVAGSLDAAQVLSIAEELR